MLYILHYILYITNTNFSETINGNDSKSSVVVYTVYLHIQETIAMYMHVYPNMVYTAAAGPPIYGCVHVPCLICSLHGIYHSHAYPTQLINKAGHRSII